MKINNTVLIMFFLLPTIVCAKPANNFALTVETVHELKGFVLKGLAIAGTIQSGCIANDDEFVVKRDGKVILETTARILKFSNEEGTDLAKGDVVDLYLPDGKKGDVVLGDLAFSKKTSCGKPKE